jgi:regulator of protease activity HflC (stomatin/prohibitin superfamily)
VLALAHTKAASRSVKTHSDDGRVTEGELDASAKLAQAAGVIAAQPLSITSRYLQTLTEIAAEKNSTIVFPLPIELLELLKASMSSHREAR